MVHPASLRAAVALLVASALCAGCGSSGSSKAAPASYVKSVCSAIAPLEKDVATRSSALNNGSSTNAAQAKKTLRGFLNAVEADSDHALTQIKSAGTPDISNGKQVSGTIVKAFTELRDAMRTAAGKANALPTDSPSAFKAAAGALGASVRGSLNNIDASGLNNAALEKAAAKEPACQSLTG